MQLEMGISTRRYLPASGTAGLERSLVNGNKRVPCPPPIITESTLLVLTDCRPEPGIQTLSVPRTSLTDLYFSYWKIASSLNFKFQNKPQENPKFKEVCF